MNVKKRVLVVEDSPVAQELIRHIIDSDPELEVVSIARSGAEALDAVSRASFDVITMDIQMPGMDGYEATRAIMESHPTPIVIVSSTLLEDELERSFRALEAGALAALRRPVGPGHPDHDAAARELVQTLKLMSEVKVVRRWPRYRQRSPLITAPPAPALPPAISADINTDLSADINAGINSVNAAISAPVSAPVGATVNAHVSGEYGAREIRIIAIGASTGGPPALQKILSELPRDFPAPVVIVQHMAAGFIRGLAEWLGQSCRLPVRVAESQEMAQPGEVYLAPDGSQMRLGAGLRLLLEKGRGEHPYCPSVSYLFSSVAEICGAKAAGVLLTGMGTDGATGLQLMRQKGAVTIAQDEESSVIFGMPREAIRIGAASYVLGAGQIAGFLNRLVNTG